MSRYRHAGFVSRISAALAFSVYLFIGISNVCAQTSSDSQPDLHDLQSEIQADQNRLLATERAEAESRRNVEALNSQINSSHARVSSFKSKLDNLTVERDSLFRFHGMAFWSLLDEKEK